MPTRRTVLAMSAGLAAPVRAAGPVVVGSKLDIEGALIGAMIIAILQKAGIPTESKLDLGPTAIVRRALLAGAIDLYPEYTGNAAFFFQDDGDPVWKDAGAGYEKAKTLDAANKLAWLAPAPADNSWVIAVPATRARAQNLHSLADFARRVNEGGAVKLAASAEFVESAAGLPAFEKTYGFKLNAAQLLVLSGGETSATMKAAADTISGVTAGMAYGTDGALAALDLVTLDDPDHAQPIYAPAPVARAATIDAYPQIPSLLAPFFARLDLATLRSLNAKIVVDGEAPQAVARDFIARG